MRLLTVLCVSAFVLPLPARSATIHVPADQPTIQAGINVAIPGDTVLVAPGTYTGADNKELDLKGKAIVLRSEAGAASTIIDCEQQGRGFYFQAGESAGSVVEGFTVKNGFVSGQFPDGWGGAILCFGSSPKIRECVVTNNNASFGGGMACYDSSPQLFTCAFGQNTTSSYGGGIYIRQGAPSMQSCTLSSNSAVFGGGIAVLEGATPNLTDCSFSANTAYSANSLGGGAYFEASGGTIANCLFTQNETFQGSGGAISIAAGNPTFQNCGFEENSAPNQHGGALYIFAAVSSFVECNLESNVAYRGGAAYFISSSGTTFSGCSFAGNVASSNVGGAVACQDAGEPSFDHCTFIANEAALGAGVAALGSSRPKLANCTFYGSLGNTIYTVVDTVRVDRCILAVSSYEAVVCEGGGVNVSCTDIYANLGGNWTGCIASQLGQNGNFSSHPLFCDATNRDFTIRATSPCAPGNSPPGCGLIGALPVGCGVTDVADEAPSASLRLTVIPNPVRGVARFEAGSAAPFRQLSIFDSQGRLVEQLTRQDGHWEWAPGSAVPAGVYFANPEASSAGTVAVKFLYLR